MDGKSLDITQERLNQLKEILPDAFTEGKIDWEKLQASLGENIEFKNERYVLNWAGKSDAFRVLQSPTTATLVPCKEESVGFDDTENIFIEGENLEVLKVLQKSYFGKIKMIYIDPPYNTGNDKFIYPDKFSESRDEYLSRIGDRDETGYMTREGLFRTNSKDSGHYHSNWLSMMYPRLFLARNLLREDGVIFVSIDDNEVHNLRLIMNEVFGEENFVAQFIWKSRQNKDNRNITGASIDHEYVVCYGRKIRGSERNLDQYKNPDNDPRGEWASANMVGLLPADQRPNCHFDLINPATKINYGRPKMGWRYDPNSMNKLIEENKIIWPKSPEGRPRRKIFLTELKEEYTGFSSIIGENIYTKNGTEEIEELFGFRAFDFPKPSSLIREFVMQGIDDEYESIVLDFFSGSSPTAHAVLTSNKENIGRRKFILVQLPEKCDENSEAYKAGYKTIAEIGKERIRRVIQKIKEDKQTKLDVDRAMNKQDLGFKVFKLQESNFKIWLSDVKTEEELHTQLTLHIDPVEKNAKIENILYELLLKSGVPLTARIEEKDGYYRVNNGEIILILKRIDEGIIKTVISEKPKKVITLDRLFKNNDQLKTNTALQLKDSEIDFRVV
jgi:adenine-specific DNA-methyltransferase